MSLPQPAHSGMQNSPTAAITADRPNNTSTKTAKAKRPKLPAKARTKCGDCNQGFTPPKKTDTTICPKCRKNLERTSASIANNTPVQAYKEQTIPLPDEYEEIALSKKWDNSINNANAAAKQLQDKPRHSVRAAGDDVDEIEDGTIDELSKELFCALLGAPKQPPPIVKESQKAAYCASQIGACKTLTERMETDENVSDASARCRLAVEEALTLHKNGVLLGELHKDFLESLQKYQQDGSKNRRKQARPMTRTGFYMDVHITCTQRIEKMIDAVGRNKLVALELLDGRKVSDLVRCPTNFLERKPTNFLGNRQKHDLEKEGGDARRKKEAVTALQMQAPTVSGTKRKAAEEDDFGDELLGGVKKTRTDDSGYGTASQTPEKTVTGGYDWQGVGATGYSTVEGHHDVQTQTDPRLDTFTTLVQHNGWDRQDDFSISSAEEDQFQQVDFAGSWAYDNLQMVGDEQGPDDSGLGQLLHSNSMQPFAPLQVDVTDHSTNNWGYPDWPQGYSAFKDDGYTLSTHLN